MRRLSGFLILFQKLGLSLAKRENPASPAGAQEGRNHWFLPSCEAPVSFRIARRKSENGDRSEKEYDSWVTLLQGRSSFSVSFYSLTGE